MGKMSDVGWMALFAARGATDGVASIRLKEAQAYVEVGDRVAIPRARPAGRAVSSRGSAPGAPGAVRR